MNTKMRHFADVSMEKISSLEKRLSGVLRPIKPRKEFIHTVASRFHTGSQASLVDRVANLQFTAMIIAGVLSLALLLAVIGRVLLGLLGKKRAAN